MAKKITVEKQEAIADGDESYVIIDGIRAQEIRDDIGDEDLSAMSREQIETRMAKIKKMFADCAGCYSNYAEGYFIDDASDPTDEDMESPMDGLGELLQDVREFATTMNTLSLEYLKCKVALVQGEVVSQSV